MLFRESERVFAQVLSQRAYVNPFHLHEVAQYEQAALAIDLPDEVKKKNVPLRQLAYPPPGGSERPNIPILLQRAEALLEVCRERLTTGIAISDHDRPLYQDLVLFVLYFRYSSQLLKTLEDAFGQRETKGPATTAKNRPRGVRINFFGTFARAFQHYLAPASIKEVPAEARLAGLFQIRRAFHLIDAKIFGRSRPVARLRAAVWQSIFTHDLRRYFRHLLYDTMQDITTLITGPSGTGKDLVAEAIGLSRYIPFDPRTERFEENAGGAFHPVNLSALPPELIESELFGHCKGAFTGALQDRAGWLEICGRSHSVFLDEIGELSPANQVKLLRVLQNRTFQRVGETDQRRFEGKVMAATNRDLNLEVRQGRFRRDFYYRLCSDIIRTPSLHEQLSDDPNELSHLVGFIAHRLYGPAGETLTKEVVAWIDEHLGMKYPWPGNFRELEQCIRNILVRKEYHPLQEGAALPVDEFTAKVRQLELTLDELVSEYCTLIYAQTGSFSDTAQRLQVDRRTVRGRINRALLERLQRSTESPPDP